MRLINPQADQPKKNKNVKSWSESKAYSAELSVYVTHDGILNRNITCSLAKQDLGTDLKLMIRDMPGQLMRNMVFNMTNINRSESCGRATLQQQQVRL